MEYSYNNRNKEEGIQHKQIKEMTSSHIQQRWDKQYRRKRNGLLTDILTFKQKQTHREY